MTKCDVLWGRVRPRLHAPIPEPKGSESENFDRLAGILMRVMAKKKAAARVRKQRKPSKPRARFPEALPRPAE